MDFEFTELQDTVRNQVRELCVRFPQKYWRDLDDSRAYPEEFVKTLTDAGFLSALIPEQYGGTGLGITEASIIMEEINRSGANGAACHAQMYTMGAILRHGNESQKERYLPSIAKGKLRLQAFGITEPQAGSDTTRISTFARKEGRKYIINGQKVFTSRFQHSDLMLLLARTAPFGDVERRTSGISLFLVDLRDSKDSIEARPIRTLINHETNELFIRDLEVSEDDLIGKEGEGFRYVLDGLNAERVLIAAECIGDGEWFIERSVDYATNRVVFDRPIGKNQGIQFPIAQVYARVKAADLVRYKAAALFDLNKSCGEEANMAKLLASEASWEAANVAMTVYGGYGMARDFDIERKMRENRLYIVAPISNNLVLSFIGEHVLGLPRSY